MDRIKIDVNAETNLQNTLNIDEVKKAGKQDLSLEVLERSDRDDVLQRQIDALAEAVNQNMLHTHNDLRFIKRIVEEILMTDISGDGYVSDEVFQNVLDDLLNSDNTDNVIGEMFNP